MREDINLDSIIWIDTNAVWLYPIIKEYIEKEKDLGMNYLTSLASLRYNERYFVGYIFKQDNPDFPIELVPYIQYKMTPSRLTLNYMEVVEKYRGNGIARRTINEFAKRVVKDSNISVDVTSFSYDGNQANLMGKLQENLKGDITEVSKRSTI